MDSTSARETLAKQIAGEIVISADPGATFRKWREDFGISQTDLANHLDISSSVISDYESGRRPSPGIDMIQRLVEGLMAVDDARGGDRIRQFARILSSGFPSDAVLDINEYPTSVEIDRLFDRLEATQLVAGERDRITGHTVIDSVETITRLSSEEFYHLYGQSTSRALVFTAISRGESPLVALRVVTPTPNAVILHGIDREDLWEHASTLARIDGYSLAFTTMDLDDLLERLGTLPEE